MFYYIAYFAKGTIRILRQSNENEVKKIERLQEPINTLLLQSRRINPIARAFNKISSINASLLRREDEYDVNDLNEAISVYLFRFRKFLDNWETYLKRNFGEDSIHYSAFKQATADAYDNNPEYQIVYRLRNVDQHCCDNIVTNVTMSIGDNGVPHIEAKTKCDYLLSIYNEWKPVEKRHLQANTEIDIFKYIGIANKCIEEIHQKAINCFFSVGLYDNCYQILGYANEYPDDREGLTFFCQEEELTKEFWERPQSKINPISWMVDKCIALLTIHLKNNTHVVRVLYRGNFQSGNLNEYGVNLDKAGLNIGQGVKIGGIDYLCYSRKLELVKDLETNIVINRMISGDKETRDRFGKIVDALVWREQIREE